MELYEICSADLVQDFVGMVVVQTQVDLILPHGDPLRVALMAYYSRQLNGYGPTLCRTD